jgi:hypothetical protein
MSTIDQLIARLTEVKETLRLFNTEDDKLKYLENYSESPQIIEIIEKMKTMKLEELEGKYQITPDEMKDKVTFLPDEINYINVIDDSPHYSIGLFFIPKGFKIPLHDHSNLIVVSKCLLGRLEMVSYDKVDTTNRSM